MITINQKHYNYNENEVFDFSEGLIGLPAMRRAVLIPLEEYQPFCWLASLDDEITRFIVVNPDEIFAGYAKNLPKAAQSQFETARDLKVLTIVKISSDWKKTTVNLRAPIVFNPQTKKGAQFILAESGFSHAETLPQN